MKIEQTPKELMISRYEAFQSGDLEYLVDTSVNQTIEELQDSPPLEWLKLDVIKAYENIVEFKAYYRQNGLDSKIYLLHEKSEFVKEGERWRYLDGTLFNTKIQRDESCPCGSGKKYKSCCAKL